MISASVFSVLALGTLVYVLFPVFKDGFWPFLRQGELAELQRARKEGLLAIADIDAEYEMGKLTREDYTSLRESLKSEVIPILKKHRLSAGEGAGYSGNHLDAQLKEDLLKEVTRICGTTQSS